MAVLDYIRIMNSNITILALLSTLLTISANPYQTVTVTVPSKNLTNTSYRLPNTTIPSKYYIDLEISEDALNGRNDTFNGCVKIEFKVTKPSDKLYLNFGVNIWNVTLTDDDKNIPNPALKYLKNSTTEILLIVFKNELVISGNYSLKICYSGDLMTDIIKGVSRIKYTEDGRINYLIATQFQPTHARYAFPCFDEPLFKATFVLKISYPVGYTAMSNRPEKETNIRNGTKTTVFQETQKMSTYLLAFSVSKLTCSKSVGHFSHKVCSREKFADDRSFALKYGLKLINAMNSWTNFNYSEGNSKIDQFAMPGITGLAMENWGLVTYHEFMLLWNKAEASSELTQETVEIIAHELSHQWFGNLVTTSWWNTLFLNEGFATYFQHYLLNLVGLEHFEMEKQLIIKQQQVAFVEDAHIDSAALTDDVSTVDEIEDKFGTISYSKGASIIKMIENVIGPNNFKKSLRVYLKKNAFDITTPEKLWDSLGSFIKKRTLPENLTFSEFTDNWTNKGGFPLVTAESNGNDVILTQNRFLYDGKSNDQWYVPVTYLSSNGGTAETVWLKPHSNVTIKNVIDNEGWIVVNHNSRGYYRVKYDDVLYSRLTKALKINPLQFTDLDRAQLVDDTFNLAMAGKITYSKLFKIVNFLQNETSYYPWDAAIRGFKDIKIKFKDSSELIRHINHILLDLIHLVANNFSVINWDIIDHVSSLKLPIIWSAACQAGQKNCVSETKRLFEELRDHSNSINPNIRQAVYCNALRYNNGSASDWKFLWNRYLSIDQPHERIYILTSLGCTTNKDLLTFYLNASINILTPFEFEIVWDSVYHNGFIGLDTAFNYFLENHSVIFEYAYEYAVGVFSNIIERLITDDQITKLEKFVDELDEDSEIRTFAKETLKSTKRNLKLKSRIKVELETYFGIHPSVVTHL